MCPAERQPENITRSEAQERGQLVEVSNYAITLDLTTGDETFTTSTVLRFSATGTPEKLAQGTWIDFIGPEVCSVHLNGKQLDLAEAVHGARILLPGLHHQNELRISARAAYSSTGVGLHRFVDPEDGKVYLYTQHEAAHARRTFAVFDQPDLKASFDFTVIAPSQWHVIASGSMTQRVPAGPDSLRWRFRPTPRISSYITGLAAGPYQGVETFANTADGRSIPMGVYARASLAKHVDSEEIFELTRRGLAFYEHTFGTPFPFEKYDQVFVPEFNAGAMENVGVVTLLEDFIFQGAVPEAVRQSRAITILHELAHMWFGNLVTMRWWDDLWLKESFAVFSSFLCADATVEDFGGAAWVNFASTAKISAYRQDQLSSTHPVLANMDSLDAVALNFDGITYSKGASVLAQLVAFTGQEAFMAGVNAYFEEFAWRTAELSDLLQHLSEASGRKLDRWSQLWLQSSGVNTLVAEVTPAAAEGTIASLRIRQLRDGADGLLRPHRIGIGIYDVNTHGQLVRISDAVADVDGELSEVPELVGQSRGKLILPNDRNLGYCRIRLDAMSAEAAVRRLGTITDPLARTMLWTSLWEAARDAELSASRYLAILAEHIHAESDSSVIRMLLRTAETAMTRYVPETEADVVRSQFSRALKHLLDSADPGSDRQLQFFKALLTHADEEHRPFLEQLESGERSFPGLGLSAELRWELLIALSALGTADIEERVKVAAAADPTASGRRSRLEALAARPRPEVKAELWHKLLVLPSTKGACVYNNVEQRRVIAGLTRIRNPALLADHTEDFFIRVPGLWRNLEAGRATTLTSGLFPHWDISTRTVKLAERAIARAQQEHPSAARLLSEGRDELSRAVKAQECDRSS